MGEEGGLGTARWASWQGIASLHTEDYHAYRNITAEGSRQQGAAPRMPVFLKMLTVY